MDGVELVENASLKRYNTYRLDVTCKYLVFPNTKEEFRDIVKFLVSNDIKHVVLGNGSNVILKNEYFDGVVILLHKLNKVKIDDDMVEVEAGYSLQKLAIEVSNMGLAGMEFATGIPGLIGASIAMNAGAYNHALSEVVTSVIVLNSDFEFVTMDNKRLDFEYRSSIFKKKKGYYINNHKGRKNHAEKPSKQAQKHAAAATHRGRCLFGLSTGAAAVSSSSPNRVKKSIAFIGYSPPFPVALSVSFSCGTRSGAPGPP